MSKRILILVAVIASCLIGCSDDSSGPSAGSGGESGAGSGGEGGVGGQGGAGGQGGTSGEGGQGGGDPEPCDGAAVGDTVERVRYAAEQVEAGEECETESQARTCTADGWSDWSGTFTASTCMVMAETGCDGMEEMRTRYEADVVPYGDECASESQTRNCTGETWGAWSGTFEHEACTVQAAANCEGASHGASATRMRYLAATVPYGATCMSEAQTAACDNGVLGAWSGTYTFEACQVEPGLPCGELASGAQNTRMRYQAATVPYGSTCAAETQTQTCDNGVLGDWTGTYTIEACTVDAPADCTDGMHGDTRMRTRYQAATVAWGTSCVSEQQTETCSNGTWSPWTGTYTHETCAVSDPIDCDGGAHGSSQMRTSYATANVPDGGTCQSEEQTRMCTNGTWGAWSGTYTHGACVVLPPFAGSCTLSNLGEPYGCIDSVGSAYTPASVMASCSAPGFAYSAAHCADNADLIGTCSGTVAIATFEQVVYYYQSAVYPSAANAQQDCTTRSGTWTAR